jgi:hypothetical protein
VRFKPARRSMANWDSRRRVVTVEPRATFRLGARPGAGVARAVTTPTATSAADPASRFQAVLERDDQATRRHRRSRGRGDAECLVALDQDEHEVRRCEGLIQASGRDAREHGLPWVVDADPACGDDGKRLGPRPHQCDARAGLRQARPEQAAEGSSAQNDDPSPPLLAAGAGGGGCHDRFFSTRSDWRRAPG